VRFIVSNWRSEAQADRWARDDRKAVLIVSPKDHQEGPLRRYSNSRASSGSVDIGAVVDAYNVEYQFSLV
jgi:hypothetical protein